jgi:outer membrane protein TolC
LTRLADQVNFQVQEAYAQVRESERNERLYREEIVPAARRQVKAADPEYVTGKIPLVTLIEAQRNVIGLQDRYYEAVADYVRRLAALERAVGGPLAPAPVPGPAMPSPFPVPGCAPSARLGAPQAPGESGR